MVGFSPCLSHPPLVHLLSLCSARSSLPSICGRGWLEKLWVMAVLATAPCRVLAVADCVTQESTERCPLRPIMRPCVSSTGGQKSVAFFLLVIHFDYTLDTKAMNGCFIFLKLSGQSILRIEMVQCLLSWWWRILKRKLAGTLWIYVKVVKLFGKKDWICLWKTEPEFYSSCI